MTALAVAPNSDDWLRARKKHIGASDAPAILGLSKELENAERCGSGKID